MKCPHCQKEFHPHPRTVDLDVCGRTKDFKYKWRATLEMCPACDAPIVDLDYRQHYGNALYTGHTYRVFPRGSGRASAPPEVDVNVANDFNEACLVLNDSPQASAALSRRCLQLLLNERGVSKSDNLSTAIDHALASGLPAAISENLDAIRNIGNFAAHPQKSGVSGVILPVEPHEAEWNLDVLDMLFDYYYVQPKRAAEKREALNRKLAEAGKNPIKEPPAKP